MEIKMPKAVHTDPKRWNSLSSYAKPVCKGYDDWGIFPRISKVISNLTYDEDPLWDNVVKIVEVYG